MGRQGSQLIIRANFERKEKPTSGSGRSRAQAINASDFLAGDHTLGSSQSQQSLAFSISNLALVMSDHSEHRAKFLQENIISRFPASVISIFN
jgi:hypothetical protein